MMRRLSLSSARAFVTHATGGAVQIASRKDDAGDYRVQMTSCRATAQHGYCTPDLDDAIGTALEMAKGAQCCPSLVYCRDCSAFHEQDECADPLDFDGPLMGKAVR